MKKNLLKQFDPPIGRGLICMGILLVGLMSGTSFAAEVKRVPERFLAEARVNITGTVKDSKGEPLPGVSVKVKGTNTGTSTNADGIFRMNLPTGNETLIFSFVGFQTREIAVNGRTTIQVVLQESNKTLDEVVVVGYGVQKKTHLTGAVASVDVRSLEDIPVSSLGASLQGRLPAVSVSNTARPGTNASLTIRNPIVLSKDGGTTSPLYVIDDVVRSETDFNMLDPSEIESWSVLKDAAAAIYGARAAQGVVIVRTKRGKVGTPVISYSGSVGAADATVLPEMMNGYELATYLNDFNGPNGKNVQNTPSTFYQDDELAYFKEHNYDWLDMAWKKSYVTRHALNVSGGTDKATYFAGASYYYQNGNLDKIDMNKWTLRASSDVKVNKSLKLGLSVSGDRYFKNMFLLKQGGENADNDVRALMNTPQFIPPYIDGYPVRISSSNDVSSFHFFEVQRLDNYTNTRTTDLNINANLQYDVPFVKGLQAKVQYNRLFSNGFPKQFGTQYTLYNFSMLGSQNHIYGGDILSSQTFKNGSRVLINPVYTDSYQLNGYLTYNRTFGKHEISALAVVEQSESKSDGVQSITEDPIPGALDDMRYAFGNQSAYETESESGSLSYIGRLNYSYAGKYLAEFSFRYDGSTNFAPENRWGFFPSLSAGWVVSEEQFFKDKVKFMDYLKIRGSVGHLGGDQTKAYSWLQRYTPQQTGGAVFGGNANKSVGMKLEKLPNRGIQWDDVLKFNLGLDTRFLNDRLSATAEGFFDHHYNMLTTLNASVPLTVGSDMPSENFSTINGFGYEISLGWKDRISKDLSYSVNGFFNWSDSRAIKVDAAKGDIGTFKDPNHKSTDMGTLGLYSLGMFRTQDEVDKFMADHPGYKIYGYTPKPGMIYYEDIRGPKDGSGQYTGPDGIIDDNDQDYINKKASNHYSFGLSLGASYKAFRLDVVLSGAFGGASFYESAAIKPATSTSSRPEFWADHWTPTNVNAAYPNPYYDYDYNKTSTFWMRSSFSFRMRSFNLNYTLPQSVATRLGLSSCKLFLNGTEPVNFYNPFSYRDNLSGSYDTYPTLRTISLGLNVSL